MAWVAPEALAALVLAPLALAAGWWLWRWRRLHRIVTRAPIVGERRGRWLSLALFALALVLLALAAARPQWGATEQALELSEFAVVIALDVSQSMAAEDVAPSRFAAAQAEVRRLIDSRRGDRVGLVIFAGQPFLRFPLTRDHASALAVLDALQPGEALAPPGSNIAAAIEMSRDTLERAEAPGVLVVVSDGETHAGNAVAAAEAARQEDIQVFTVGVGTTDGANVPIGGGLSGRPSALKLDARSGQPVVSRLDADALREVAEAGGGRYIELRRPGSMTAMNADLAAVELSRDVAKVESALHEQYRWFAALALVALFAASAVRVVAHGGWARNRVVRRIARGLGLAALVASAAAISGCQTSTVERANTEGAEHYAAGRYGEALESWRKAQRADQRGGAVDPRLHLNAGRALHQLGQYERAETESLAALRSTDPAIRALAWFHTGNHRWANQDLLGARAAYIEALREQSGLRDAKINLELVNNLLEQAETSDQAQGQEESSIGSESGQSGEPGEPGSSGQTGEGSSQDAQPGDPDSAQPGSDAASASETESEGRGAGAPTNPSFAEEDRSEARQQALTALQEALNDLPLENASLEQALAVLDALRAVPGDRLAAGSLAASESGVADW